MGKYVSFQLDLTGGALVLQEMASKQVNLSAKAIAGRAEGLSGVKMVTTSGVGVIKRGGRYIATVHPASDDPHDSYKAFMALKKSIDAGKV